MNKDIELGKRIRREVNKQADREYVKRILKRQLIKRIRKE